ncbi:VWA domain-containing protein [Candidatus Woesearchaeota archaeon]|nr:VWA domain-containing protein [Candidatus Woesearchaeota archaeon]
MVIFSLVDEVKNLQKAEELEGKLAPSETSDKLMHSVLEADKDTVNDGKIAEEAVNRGINNFTPDLMFQNLVTNYAMTKKLYGEKLLRLITGYSGDYLEKNIKIPEFRKDLKNKIETKIKDMKQKDVLTKEGRLTEKAIQLASLILFKEELDKLSSRNYGGEKTVKEISHYGEKSVVKNWKKGDRYKDLAIKQSIRRAIKRGHQDLIAEDLKTWDREKKGNISIIYAIDSSASMKGEKIEMSKRAGVALAFQALQEKDKVGLVIFGKDVKESLPPSNNFGEILDKIIRIKTEEQTQFRSMIQKAIELFPREEKTKHLMILSDALPTVGDKPQEDTLKLVAQAKAEGITVSLIGIKLDKEGAELGKKIVEVGDGKFYHVKKIDEMDRLVLEDYYSLVQRHAHC